MTAQRLVSELPDARLRLISDAGHHQPRRAPGAVAEAIAGFVAALDETAAGDSGDHVTAPGQVNSGTTRSACINGLRPRLQLLCKSAVRVRFPSPGPSVRGVPPRCPRLSGNRVCLNPAAASPAPSDEP